MHSPGHPPGNTSNDILCQHVPNNECFFICQLDLSFEILAQTSQLRHISLDIILAQKHQLVINSLEIQLRMFRLWLLENNCQLINRKLETVSQTNISLEHLYYTSQHRKISSEIVAYRCRSISLEILTWPLWLRTCSLEVLAWTPQLGNRSL